MTLGRNQDGSWSMTTHNPCTRAWRGRMGSLKRFETLAAVEDHYKSWKGVAAIYEASAAIKEIPRL